MKKAGKNEKDERRCHDEKESSDDIAILLVEDNEINQRFFVKILQVKGFKCDIAVNGQEQ